MEHFWVSRDVVQVAERLRPLVGRKLSIIRIIVKAEALLRNSFRILKQTFRELLLKTTFDIKFLSDVVNSCYLLHILILDGQDMDVEELMTQLEWETQGQAARRMPDHEVSINTEVEPDLEGDSFRNHVPSPFGDAHC